MNTLHTTPHFPENNSTNAPYTTPITKVITIDFGSPILDASPTSTEDLTKSSGQWVL